MLRSEILLQLAIIESELSSTLALDDLEPNQPKSIKYNTYEGDIYCLGYELVNFGHEKSHRFDDVLIGLSLLGIQADKLFEAGMKDALCHSDL